MRDLDWDVVVVGRSFGGLSAALTLGRCRRSVLVIGSGGPRNAAVHHAHGLLSRDGISPVEMIQVSEGQLQKYESVALVDARVDAITTLDDGFDDGFVIAFGGRTVTAAFVILATGVNDDPPPIPGLAEHWGRGVFTCPFCDGFENRDAAIAVVGVPAFAPHTARMLTGWSNDVTVHVDGLDPAVVAELVELGVRVDARAVVRVSGDGESVSSIELDDGTVQPIGAIFVSKLPVPNTSLAVGLGCATDDLGFVVTDAMKGTTVPAVWAVGDVTGMRHQMAYAIADGITAAADCNTRLLARRVPAA